jgi:hypothetical protein
MCTLCYDTPGGCSDLIVDRHRCATFESPVGHTLHVAVSFQCGVVLVDLPHVCVMLHGCLPLRPQGH